MITKAIIESIESDGYHFKVRIPILHKIENAPGATPYKELPIAAVSFAPGCRPNLNVGDVVYVAFENDQYSSPVIIGMLLNDSYVNSSASIIADTLDAAINVNLPNDELKFGNTSLADIINNISISDGESGGGGDLTKAELELLLRKILELYV